MGRGEGTGDEEHELDISDIPMSDAYGMRNRKAIYPLDLALWQLGLRS